MQKPKLFISFTGTLLALQSGRVNASDLATGLFVFGCTRDHAMQPGAAGEYVEDIVTKRPDLHLLLVAALLEAEAEGRIRWRTIDDFSARFELVDDLLVSNGHKPLMSEQEYYTETWMCRNYCYPAVEERSTELEVIWHG